MPVSTSAERYTHTPLPDPAPDRILDDVGVSLITTMPRSTIVRLSREGAFPAPVALYPGRIGWRMSDIQRWISALMPAGERS